jgi:hypothetical protein
MHHAILAGFDLAGIYGDGATRIDNNDAGLLHGLSAEFGFFLSTEVPRKFGTQ